MQWDIQFILKYEKIYKITIESFYISLNKNKILQWNHEEDEYDWIYIYELMKYYKQLRG